MTVVFPGRTCASDANALVTALRKAQFGIDAGDLAEAVPSLSVNGRPVRGQPPKAVLADAAGAFLKPNAGLRSSRRPEVAVKATASNAARVVTEMLLLVGRSLTGNQVADLLGVASATVRDRKRDGRLYAVHGPGNSNCFPRWQLVEGERGAHVLPHLAEVLAALPEGMHPLEVQAFFTEPRTALTIFGEQLSAADWLAAGGDARPVLDDAESIGVLGCPAWRSCPRRTWNGCGSRLAPSPGSDLRCGASTRLKVCIRVHGTSSVDGVPTPAVGSTRSSRRRRCRRKA